MDQHGQMYFDLPELIPDEDKKRLEELRVVEHQQLLSKLELEKIKSDNNG